ncbi:MAG: esterase [Flavobacteriales bacterium]|nr:esterase [Flavobacteriales bacterium]
MSEDHPLPPRMDPKAMEALGKNTIAEAIGLEILEVEHGRVVGRLPVDARTHQPYGLLHGGASVVLAETLGSVGSHFIAAPLGKAAVGIEVNANHLRGARSGWVTGTATLHHEGGRLHVWHIDIRDERNRAICASRLTVMLVPQAAGQRPSE